jgi:hypothetical protein
VGEGMMGNGAMAEDKHESGTRLEMIGWTFDLRTQTVTISERNHLKTVHCFFSLKTTEKQRLRTWQGIASRASRYAAVCQHMRPYTSAFHRTVQNFNDNTVSLRIPDSDSVFDLLIWRSFLCLLAFQEETFARPLLSFRPVVARIKIEYDASLTGLGILISQRNNEQDAWTLLYHSSMLFPFNVQKDSSYQNTCEFLAVAAALVILTINGHRAFTYDLYGDSVSSLLWCQNERTKSLLARQAMFGFSLLSVYADATLGTTIHVPGKSNITCDQLSRGVPTTEVHLSHTTLVDATTTSAVTEFLLITNPLLVHKTQTEQEQGLRSLLAFLVRTFQQRSQKSIGR